MNRKLSPRRRALSLLLALSLMLGLLPGTSMASEASPASNHWAASYLNQLVEWGFIRADQAQNPDRALTRADFMSIVNRAYGYHEAGPIPFEDVSEFDWYYDDVGIAYTAGYIKGTSPTTASPNNTLNRETAATILGRNMMLQESPGEILDFTDARDISNWARGTIKSSMEHYLVNGYDDGTFRPQNTMTWGEIAAMVTRTIGTPLQDEGDYSLGGVFGNVTVTSPGVTLRDTVISGDLYITGGVGLGGIKLENVTVLGRIIASGTGSSEGGASILLRNVTADELLVDNLQDKEVSIQADGITEIGMTTVRSSAYIEDNTPDGLGLHMISFEGDSYGEDEEPPEGWVPPTLTLAGRIEEVINRTPDSTVHAAKGTVAKLTIDETATGSHVIIDRGEVVKNLILDTGVDVTGEGDITRLEVNAPGCDVAMLPDEIVIRPGITAIIAGEEMDSVAAEEASLEPLILAGYPRAEDVAPTSLDAVFSTNKKGTIYWAVSDVSDGSVGADDLLKPSSYGSKAVRWGTLVSPKGNEETIAKISGLQPGGSYYLSAVLEDAKGQLSPVKVISFTTPDNTLPAFCAGYPHMSKVSPSDSIVVVMPNKDCKLYYALLPEGAVAPTEAELRANAVAGALGYGVRDVQKNMEDVFRVNDVILAEQTKYVLYLWLVDADGVNKSPITSLPFTTDDETPPEFIVDPTVNSIQATSVGLTFRLNEDGTVYWVAVPAGTPYPKPEPGTDYETAPLTSDYAKLQVASGMNLGTGGKAGTVKATANVDGTINVSGLLAESAYDFYYLAKDNAGPDRNYSVTVKKITINTLDTTGPKFHQSFSKYIGLDDTVDPRADTDIYLDVSENIRYSGQGGGRSFLDLYQDIKDASGEAARNLAIEKLASNLAGSIVLHKVNVQDASEEIVPVNTTVGAAFGPELVVDYTKVTIEPHESGIRIIFPAEGLHLENGAEYYFTIQNITDTSNNQNPLANPAIIDFKHNEVASAAAGHNVPPFVVESATVILTSPGVGAGDGPFLRNSAGVPTTDPARVDLSFRMTPNSTSTVNDALSYDVLLWTDSILTYDLYYRVIDSTAKKIHTGAGKANAVYPQDKLGNLLPERGGAETREVDANGWIYLGNSGPVNPTQGAWSGRSLNKSFNGCGATSFPLLKNLSEDLRYEFVIVLQEYGGNPVHDTWNGEVKFHINVAAGQSNNLDNLGGALTETTWADALKKGLNSGARSIGRQMINTEIPTDTLEISRRFSDSRLPYFVGGSPTFANTTYNSTVINYTLSTAGTVYYAIGKAVGPSGVPEITTTRKLTTDEEKFLTDNGTNANAAWGMDGVPGEAGVYYVKTTDGNPPGSKAPSLSGASVPDWMKGYNENSPGDDLPEGDNLIENPKPLYIFNPNAWTDTMGALTGSSQTQGVKNVEVPVSGLEPNTTYFAYFVIKGEADTLSHVYIFQFTTEEASKPRIDLGRREDGASIRTDIDSQLDYFVFTLRDAQSGDIKYLNDPFDNPKYLNPELGITDGTTSKLPSYYQGTKPNGEPFTVLDALLTKYQAGALTGESNLVLPLDKNGNRNTYNDYSVFDIFASEFLKTEMSNFLHGKYTSSFLDNKEVDIVEQTESLLTMKGGTTRAEKLEHIYRGTDYVILAVAHVPNYDPKMEEWQVDSYAAYAPIRIGSVTPPTKESWFAAITTGLKGDESYPGIIEITFDQKLYSDDRGRTELTAASLLDANSGVTWWPTSIKDRVTVTVNNDGGRATISFTGDWKLNDYIRIPKTILHNYNGEPALYDLLIQVGETDKGDGVRVTMKWDTDKGENFDFPYKTNTSEINASILWDDSQPANVKDYATLTGNPEATQTLTISPALPGGAIILEARLDPAAYEAGAVYTWSSSNTGVIVPNSSGPGTNRRETFTIKGAGTATITLQVVAQMGDGTTKTATKTMNIVVTSTLTLTNVSTSNGFVWDPDVDRDAIKCVMSATNPNPLGTITLKTDFPLNITNPESITVTCSPSPKTFNISSKTITSDATSSTITFMVTLNVAPPENGSQVLTVRVGGLSKDIAITFEGSQSNLPITPGDGGGEGGGGGGISIMPY